MIRSCVGGIAAMTWARRRWTWRWWRLHDISNVWYTRLYVWYAPTKFIWTGCKWI